MLNLANLLIFLTFSLPLILGILIILCKACYTRWILGFEIGFVVAGLVGLGFLGEQDIVSSLSFMGEPITFSISTTPILLFLGSLLVLAVMVWHHSRVGKATISRYQYVLLNLSLSFGFIAFISGQFMIRYIALDIVGLLAALTVLSQFVDSLSIKRFTFIFLLLRLGDLSLLVSILLINQHADTLDISQMINAAIDLPVSTRIWVFMGFLLAILIKLAIWPFGVWLQRARETTSGVNFWISGLLMPSLGTYLLYRVIPIISSDIFFQNFTLYLGMILIVLVMLATILQLVKFDRFTQMSGIYGCFLLGAAAFGANQYLVYYILGLTLYRMALFFQDEATSIIVKSLVTLIPVLFNGLFIAVNFNHFPIVFTGGWVIITGLTVIWGFWITCQKFVDERAKGALRDFRSGNEIAGGFVLNSAQWLYQQLEVKLFSIGVSQLSDFFGRVVAWLYQNLEIGLFSIGVSQFGNFFVNVTTWLNTNVEQGFETVWSGIGQKLMATSEETYSRLEVDPDEKTGVLVNDALNSLDTYEQNVLRKSLQWDLAWIPLLLLVILILLFVL